MYQNFEFPKNKSELFALKKAVTSLVAETRVRIALNKLCSPSDSKADRQKKRASYASDAGLVKAAGEPSIKTAGIYMRRGAFNFSLSANSDIDVWTHISSTSLNVGSWNSARQAVQYFLVAEAIRLKAEVEKLQPAIDDPKEKGLRELQASIKGLIRVAYALSQVPNGAPSRFKANGKDLRSSKSKAKSLRNLPDDWREQVFHGWKSKFAIAGLVMAVTGCRPEEVRKGVKVRLNSSGEVETQIQGAKTGKNAGQELRWITVPSNEGLGRLLGRSLKPGVVYDTSSLVANTNTFGRAVSRRMEQVWGPKLASLSRRDKRVALSIYSLRHQMKADLLANGTSRELIAKALGHSTTASAKHYGIGVRAGRSAVKPSYIEASRPVKTRAANLATAKKPLAKNGSGVHQPKKPLGAPRTPKPY